MEGPFSLMRKKYNLTITSYTKKYSLNYKTLNKKIYHKLPLHRYLFHKSTFVHVKYMEKNVDGLCRTATLLQLSSCTYKKI